MHLCKEENEHWKYDILKNHRNAIIRKQKNKVLDCKMHAITEKSKPGSRELDKKSVKFPRLLSGTHSKYRPWNMIL